jgi:hypothetical protein
MTPDENRHDSTGGTGQARLTHLELRSQGRSNGRDHVSTQPVRVKSDDLDLGERERTEC